MAKTVCATTYRVTTSAKQVEFAQERSYVIGYYNAIYSRAVAYVKTQYIATICQGMFGGRVLARKKNTLG